MRQLTRTQIVAQLQPQAALDLGAAGADLNQEAGKARGAKGGKICLIQGFL